MLRASLPGGVGAERWDRPIRFSTREGAALVALLALRPGTAIPRARLAAMLRPISGEAAARTSLRQALATLRRDLGDTFIGSLVSNFINLGAGTDTTDYSSLAGRVTLTMSGTQATASKSIGGTDEVIGAGRFIFGAGDDVVTLNGANSALGLVEFGAGNNSFTNNRQARPPR